MKYKGYIVEIACDKLIAGLFSILRKIITHHKLSAKKEIYSFPVWQLCYFP